jgi:hypothetical protein
MKRFGSAAWNGGLREGKGRQEPPPPLRTKRSDCSTSAYTSRLRTSYSSSMRWSRTSRASLLRRLGAIRPRMPKPRHWQFAERPLCATSGHSITAHSATALAS